MANRLFLIGILSIIITDVTFCQEGNPSLLDAPEGWRPEFMRFPLPFAPSLDYKGAEDIRFAPGWSDKSSKEFWAYSFLWYLDEDPQLTPQKLEKDFVLYFDGLMKVVGEEKGLDSGDMKRTSASFSRSGANGFKGQVNIFDAFFSQQEIQLNFDLEESFCEKATKHLTLFRISPQSYDNEVWNSLRQVQLGVDCK